jgi:hypothetical protein
MRSRPLSVTVVGVILIWWGVVTVWRILSIAGLAGLVAVNGLWSETRSSDGLLFVTLVVAAGIEFVAGVNILRGANWARMLWSVWCVFHIFLSFLLSLDKNLSLGPMIIQFFIILFLFLPRANEYFVAGD